VLPKFFGGEDSSSESKEKLGRAIQSAGPLQKATDGKDPARPKTLGKKLADFAGKYAFSSAVRALGDQESYIQEKEGSGGGGSSGGDRDVPNSNDGGVRSLENTEKIASPLNRLVSIMGDIRTDISQILNIVKQPQPTPETSKSADVTDNPGISADTGKSAAASYATSVQYAFSSNLKDPKVIKPTGDQDFVASGSGESPTSAYDQNEKETKTNTLDEFGSKALEQLAGIFDKAFEKLENSLKQNANQDSGGLIPPIINPFGKKAPKPINTKGPKTKGPQPRGPDGRFIKRAPAAPAPSMLGRLGGAMKSAGAASAGLLRGAGRFAGVAAVPVLAAMDYSQRRDEGQSQKDAGIGTAGGVAGGLAGGLVGAKGGALIGGGLGSLLGPAGTAAGAIGGGIIGGVGGAVVGSDVGGWLADKANQYLTPKMSSETMAQTKDVIELEKRRLKKIADTQTSLSSQQPTMISAPTTNSSVSNQQVNLSPNISPIKGSRGSLDLQNY
jgi:hypothetical protein